MKTFLLLLLTLSALSSCQDKNTPQDLSAAQGPQTKTLPLPSQDPLPPSASFRAVQTVPPSPVEAEERPQSAPNPQEAGPVLSSQLAEEAAHDFVQTRQVLRENLGALRVNPSSLVSDPRSALTPLAGLSGEFARLKADKAQVETNLQTEQEGAHWRALLNP